MGIPATSANFPDILDPRFQKIFDNQYTQLPDRRKDFYRMENGSSFPTKDTARFSEVGAFGDIPLFNGTVTYDDVAQGYDKTLTHLEYASGFQITRKLFADDAFGVMDGKPRGLAVAYNRTQQKHAAQTFNNAFSVDTTWLSNSENVALCSNSHTTTSGASTASGFDNLVTSAFSSTALVAARIQFRGFRDDRANRIATSPDFILHPVDIYDTVYEVLESQGKPGVTTNDANVHREGYTAADWEYLTDTNNWFLIDKTMMKQFLLWIEREPMEFAMIEEFDTIIAKWRVYCRYSLGHTDWRWMLGAQVS